MSLYNYGILLSLPQLKIEPLKYLEQATTILIIDPKRDDDEEVPL